MKRLGSLERIRGKPRLNRWADLRHYERERLKGRSAGVMVRNEHHIVRVHDVSPGGVCIDVPVLARVNDRVTITFASRRRIGHICWIADGRAGVELTF